MSDFKSEMHQIRFPLELRPNLAGAGGAYSAPSDLLDLMGPTSIMGGSGVGKERGMDLPDRCQTATYAPG